MQATVVQALLHATEARPVAKTTVKCLKRFFDKVIRGIKFRLALGGPCAMQGQRAMTDLRRKLRNGNWHMSAMSPKCRRTVSSVNVCALARSRPERGAALLMTSIRNTEILMFLVLSDLHHPSAWQIERHDEYFAKTLDASHRRIRQEVTSCGRHVVTVRKEHRNEAVFPKFVMLAKFSMSWPVSATGILGETLLVTAREREPPPYEGNG